MDYTNSFAGLPDANIPDNPFYSGINQSRREQTMLPFLQNANTQSDLETQKAQQTQTEFMSHQAQQMREAERQRQLVNSQQESKLIPERAGLESGQIANKKEMLGPDQKIALETARQKLDEIKGTPQRAFFDSLGADASRIEKLPPPMQAQEYTRIVQQHNQLFPNDPVPQQYATYNPQTSIPLMKTMEHMGTMSKETRAKLAEGQQKGEYQLKDQKLQNEGNAVVARIHEAGQNSRNERTIEEGNPAKQIFALRSTIEANKDPDKVARAKALITPMIYEQAVKSLNASEAFKDMSMRANNFEGKDKMAEFVINHFKQQFMFNKIDPDTVPEIKQMETMRSQNYMQEKVKAGILRMPDLKKMYPNKSEQEIRTELQKRGIEVKD